MGLMEGENGRGDGYRAAWVQSDGKEAPHKDIYGSFPPTGLTMVR